MPYKSPFQQIFKNLISCAREIALFSNVLPKTTRPVTCIQTYATKAEKKRGMDRKPTPKIEYTMKSIAAKGFLRPARDYIPSEEYKQVLQGICQQYLKTDKPGTILGDKKADILMQSAEKLNHSVPNSLLHQIISIADLISFYGEAVSTKTPLDKMRNMPLPENLHVQYEYNRWHPDTDDKFGGITAYPQSSTLVTGLKYRGKYKGHKQDIKFPRE